MNKINVFNRYLYAFIFSMISTLVFIVDFAPVNPAYLVEDIAIYRFFSEISISLDTYNGISVILWIFIFYFYFNTYFDGAGNKKKNIFLVLMAIVISVFTIICKSYSYDNTLNVIYSSNVQIIKTVLFFVGYILIYYALFKKISILKLDLSVFKKKTKFIVDKINKHPIITSFILIMLMWLPWMIISYPGLSNADTMDQLNQFFHQDNSWTIKTINLLSPDVYINKHHSVFHTVVLGVIFKLGNELVSYRFGAAIFVFLQVLLLAGSFSFLIKYMKKLKISSLIVFWSILFVGLNPIVVTYAICAVKDTPNAIFNMLYVIFLLQIVRNFDSIYKSKLRLVLLLVTILMVLLLRNNGIYTFLLSFPWLLLIYRKYWKKVMLTFLIPIMIFGLYDKVLLPSLNVSDGSIREALSVPMMQLARVARDKPDAFSNGDIEKIDAVFDFSKMKGHYDPYISDEIKDGYRINATDEELKSFFGVWFKYLKKYPNIYVESVVNSTFWYFYPGGNRDIFYLVSGWGRQYMYDINCLEVFSTLRGVINKLLRIYYDLPFFMNKVAYFDWVLIISCFYIIKKKKYKYLIPLSALVAVLLSCLASPLNGSYRYILPIIFSLPVILLIDYIVYRECKESL